jgi:hypothetical protein
MRMVIMHLNSGIGSNRMIIHYISDLVITEIV